MGRKNKEPILSFLVDSPAGRIEFFDDEDLGFSIYRFVTDPYGEIISSEKLFWVNSLGEKELLDYLVEKHCEFKEISKDGKHWEIDSEYEEKCCKEEGVGEECCVDKATKTMIDNKNESPFTHPFLDNNMDFGLLKLIDGKGYMTFTYPSSTITNTDIKDKVTAFEGIVMRIDPNSDLIDVLIPIGKIEEFQKNLYENK